MSKRPPIAEIINGGQADLLDLMRDAPGRLSRVDLLASAGMSRTLLNRHLMALCECALVDFAKASELPPVRTEHRGRSTLLYTITMAGSLALARYKRRLEDAERVVVAPPTFNTADQPPYAPPSGAFYRNAGNKHIPSRGFSC